MKKIITKKYLDKVLKILDYIDFLVDKNQLRNEQYILDFYDKLNEISVRK